MFVHKSSHWVPWFGVPPLYAFADFYGHGLKDGS